MDHNLYASRGNASRRGRRLYGDASRGGRRPPASPRETCHGGNWGSAHDGLLCFTVARENQVDLVPSGATRFRQATARGAEFRASLRYYYRPAGGDNRHLREYFPRLRKGNGGIRSAMFTSFSPAMAAFQLRRGNKRRRH
jgi:hypothetical protein